ncbi:hypothetical protein Bca4012_058950 [Brassica carinata]
MKAQVGIVDYGDSLAPNEESDECIERSRQNVDSLDSKPSEIYRFELLRNEMIELEKRVQRSTYELVNEEGSSGDPSTSSSSTKGVELVQISKKENFPEKHSIKSKKQTQTCGKVFSFLDLIQLLLWSYFGGL